MSLDIDNTNTIPFAIERGLSRQERRILAELRTGGHCPILNSHLKTIGKLPDDTYADTVDRLPRQRYMTIGATAVSSYKPYQTTSICQKSVDFGGKDFWKVKFRAWNEVMNA